MDFGPDRLKVYDSHGMGFVMSGTNFHDVCFSLKSEEIAYFLRVILDETCFSVLKCISIDNAVTEKEICERANIDEETANRILLGLMKRDIVCCDVDNHGKRGYLQSQNMAGVYMVLAGCSAACCGGEPDGYLWFTRINKE